MRFNAYCIIKSMKIFNITQTLSLHIDETGILKYNRNQQVCAEKMRNRILEPFASLFEKDKLPVGSVF